MHDPVAVRRILVALDESARGFAALSTAGALAAELDAELAGLFVEDVNLQRLAGLPFVREFSLFSGELSPLSAVEMERAWRREAELMQRRLAAAAAQRRLRWSFQVARGKVSAEVSTQAAACDLLVLGRGTTTSAVALARATYRHTAGPAEMRAGPVMVLFGDLPGSAASLDTGARLARVTGADLVLLIEAEDEEAYRAACADARTASTGRGVDARCQWLSRLDGVNLIRAARRGRPACLVLPDRERFLTHADMCRVLDEIDCPIVLTR